MGTFAEQAADLVIHTTKTASFDPPKFWWHNGDRKAKTPGTFYARAADYPEGLGAPWAAEDRFDNEQGFAAAELKIAVLLQRSQPFREVKDDTGKTTGVEWLTQWAKGDKILTELLCLVEGYEQPVVWSMKGMTAKAVVGRGGILWAYRDGLLKTACKLARRALPQWSFWLPIASKRTTDGKIAYEDTGFSSFITPPALHFPDNAIDTLFGGQALIDRGEDALALYPDWAEFRRLPGNTVEADAVVETVPALPAARRNVPQPITDADLPADLDTF